MVAAGRCIAWQTLRGAVARLPQLEKATAGNKSRPLLYTAGYEPGAGSTSRTISQNASGPSAISAAASRNGGV
jgi:hypothetical protein